MSHLLKDKLEATLQEMNEGNEENSKVIETQLKEIDKKIQRLEEKFIIDEIDKTLYEKFLSKYKEEKREIEKELEKTDFKKSNLSECVNIALKIASKLP